MASFTETFKRKEQKYMLDRAQAGAVLALAGRHMVKSPFSDATVLSLYFDTPAHEMIERSLDKPLYKEKLRLRVYGEPRLDGPAFLEIKKKFKGVVYKRRVCMSLAAAEAYMDGMPYVKACQHFPLADPVMAEKSLSVRSLQIAAEIDYLRSRFDDLGPTILVSCYRQAFVDVDEESELRITLDSNLRCAVGAKRISDAVMLPIIEKDLSILEIKNAGPMPLWLAEELGRIHTYPQSFSKVGTAYMTHCGDDASDPYVISTEVSEANEAEKSIPQHIPNNTREERVIKRA